MDTEDCINYTFKAPVKLTFKMNEKKYWSDGVWQFSELMFFNFLHEVKGNNSCLKNINSFDYPDCELPELFNGSWSYGDFGDTSTEIKNASGADKYNVEMTYWNGTIKLKGVVSKDGRTIYALGMMGKMSIGKWLDENDLKDLRDDREDTNAMTFPYKVQPDKQGKIIWISGLPGAGKKVGHLMAKEMVNEIVYYEADCFMNLQNPYLPPDANKPSIVSQKSVKVLFNFSVFIGSQ